MNNEDTLLAIVFGFLAFFAVLFVISVIFYIFKAVGLFKMAKKDDREDLAWLGWIPVANTFLMMLLTERVVHEGIRGKMTLIYGITMAASVVLGSWIPFLPFLPGILFFYAFYFLAKRYSPNPILHLVLGIITITFSTSISIFIFRNREPNDPSSSAEEIDVSNTEDTTL